jgi:hypothetical protein
MALLEERSGDVETPDCARAELLVAMGEQKSLSGNDQLWLSKHVESCPACAELIGDE